MLKPVLRELAADLWVAEAPLRFFGLEIGARTTLVRLPGGTLFVHSPISRSAQLAEAVERLGRPSVVVAPNRFHHLFAAEWSAAYPSARLFVAPGVESKRPELPVAGVLGDEPDPEWAPVLDQCALRGFPLANEVVFFHRPSRTLIASDLGFHIGAEATPLTRLAFRLAGAYGRFSVTALERLAIRDRAAFRSSLEKVLRWPISRVIVAHGSVVETDGRAALAAAYAWLLGSAAGR
jgi:hypothetical protein